MCLFVGSAFFRWLNFSDLFLIITYQNPSLMKVDSLITPYSTFLPEIKQTQNQQPIPNPHDRFWNHKKYNSHTQYSNTNLISFVVMFN